MDEIPDNLIRLHKQEELLWAQAVEAVSQDVSLRRHLQAVHDVMDHLTVLARLSSASGTDTHTLQLLGIRLLNFIAACLKSGLSGYYQVAFSLLRETLETANLIDLFLIKPELISVWKSADKKAHNNLFRPVKVREVLSAHPNYKGQNRLLRYQMFSTYASHPNYLGFALLSGDDSPKIGPFLDRKLLKALLEDMGSLGGHATLNLSIAIETDDGTTLTAKSAFTHRLKAYWEAVK